MTTTNLRKVLSAAFVLILSCIPAYNFIHEATNFIALTGNWIVGGMFEVLGVTVFVMGASVASLIVEE